MNLYLIKNDLSDRELSKILQEYPNLIFFTTLINATGYFGNGELKSMEIKKYKNKKSYTQEFKEYPLPKENKEKLIRIWENRIVYSSGDVIYDKNYLGVIGCTDIIFSSSFDRRYEFEPIIKQVYELIYDSDLF